MSTGVENKNPMKVCYFGTYRENYSRNRMMINGLRMNGIIVEECHETLWHGIEDRVKAASAGWVKPKFWGRILRTYWKLLKRYKNAGDYDVLIVGYPGQLDVFLARFLTWLKRKPLVWDIFMSIYLIAIERDIGKTHRLSIRLLKLVEGIALKIPDMLILDTSEYVNWFTQIYGINPKRFRLIPTGADDQLFHPFNSIKTNQNKFDVLYAGTFIPNHGVRYIVEAANLLKNEQQIAFTMIGDGPEREFVKNYVNQNQLQNVKFIDWVAKEDLVQHMNQADICLGAFGTTPQSLMTVQNKIFETLAMAKPVISGDSTTIRQYFNHKEHIYICDRANGQALAEAIIDLWKNPSLREQLASNGYRLFIERYNLANNGKRFAEHLLEFTH